MPVFGAFRGGEWVSAPLGGGMAAFQVVEVVRGTPAWPEIFSGVDKLPDRFWAQGNLALIHQEGMAVVGSRRCTATGRDNARRVSTSIVQAGGVVVSGLAAGIDAEAHDAAPGRTIAVLGQGMDSPMARWQQALRDRLLQAGGLVLSEFPAHAAGADWTFPKRNRMIAALSRAVVVVEAATRSGSKITANFGADMGREVWAIPGPPGVESCAGCLDLIEHGAQVVRSVGELGRLVLRDGPNALRPC